MPVERSTPFDFELFLSYSHGPDYRLARRIESFLESFHKRVPARSRDKLAALQICVDGSDFKLPPRTSTQREVPSVIRENLARSRELLVLCSESARRSTWVNQEIDDFLQTRPEAIRLALTEGADPLSEPERYVAPHLIERGIHRTICYDLRGFDRSRAREWSKVADFDRELVRLAADLNGLSAGEVYPLWLEEERRRTRRIAISTTVAVVLVLAGSGFGIYQRSERLVAQANERTAQANEKAAEAARTSAELAKKVEEEKRRTADALRLASNAFERLYRNPLEALDYASQSGQLLPSETADRALSAAYRVAIFRNENRRQANRLTGSGPGYMAWRWSESGLTSVISPDGRYLVVITPRGRAGVTGPDGKPMPGELYLIDNETQRPIQLDNCRTDDIERRVEYVGFDSHVENLFVTRQYNLMAYSTTGDCLGTVLLECCTKSPIHRVDGYLVNRYLIAADTKGGLWLAEMKNGARPITVRHEWSRDTVIGLTLSDDRSRAVVVSESGRAAVLSLAANGRPVETDLVRRDALAAAFAPGNPSVMALAGTAGLAQVWELAHGRPVLARTFKLPDVPIESVSFTSDGKRLIAISEDLRVYVLDAGKNEPIATLRYPIEWNSSRKVPNHYAAYRPDDFEEPGERVALTNVAMAVSRMESLNGKTWLFAVRKPDDFFKAGPAFLVDDDMATALPDRETDVYKVEEHFGSTWIYTANGAYRLEARGLRLLLPPKIQVLTAAEIGQALWFGTDHGAWRVQGNEVARFTRTDVRVWAIAEIGGRLWFSTSVGLHRLDSPDRLLRVTGEDSIVRKLVSLRGQTWALTGSDSEPGPALLLSDLSARPLPGRTESVADVVDAGGATWLIAAHGLYRADGERVKKVEGITSRADVKDVAGRVVAIQRSLLGAGPAFLIRDTHAVRLVPEAQVTQVQAIQGVVYLTTAVPENYSTRPGPLYRLQGDQALLLTPPDSRVESIRWLDGRVWLSVHDEKGRPRAALLDAGRIVEPGSQDPAFLPLQEVITEGTHWLLGDGGACLAKDAERHCFRTPGLRVSAIRRGNGQWWLLTRTGLHDPGPAYHIEGANAQAVPTRETVVDVGFFANAAWLVTTRDGKPMSLVRFSP